MNITTLAACAAIAMSLFACSNTTHNTTSSEGYTDSVKAAVTAKTQEVQSAYAEDKETAEKKLKKLRDDLNKAISDINDTLKTVHADGTQKLNKAKDELTKQKEEVSKALKDVEEASENTWNEVKEKSKKVSDDVQTSFIKTKEDVQAYLDEKF